MLERETISAVTMFGRDCTQLDNQKKISEFEDKLQHAKDLYAKTYPQTEEERAAELENPPWTNPEFIKREDIRTDISMASEDLSELKTIYVDIEKAMDNPSGYEDYRLEQEYFDGTAGDFEQNANRALEDLRDPQTFAGDVREVGRDVKDTAQDFWNWIRG